MATTMMSPDAAASRSRLERTCIGSAVTIAPSRCMDPPPLSNPTFDNRRTALAPLGRRARVENLMTRVITAGKSNFFVFAARARLR